MTTRMKKNPRPRLTSQAPCQSATTVRPEGAKTGQAADNKPEPKAEAYEPIPREQTAIEKYRAQTAGDSPALRITADNERVSLNHPHQGVGEVLLMEALGTHDRDVAWGLIGQLINIAGEGYNCTDGQLNFLVSLVKGMQPTDHVQGMVAVQAVAVHTATMRISDKLARAVSPQEQEVMVRMLCKLSRNFATLVETFNHCRNGGENVTVQNVQVNEGGQAVVANVGVAAGETAPDKAAASPPARGDSDNSETTIVHGPKAAVLQFKRGKKV